MIEEPISPAGDEPAGQLLRANSRVWLMTLGHLAIDSYNAFLFALIPLFMIRLHINFALAGLLTTLLLSVSSVLQPVFGYLDDRYPRLPLSAAGLLVSGFAMAGSGFVSSYAVMVAVVVLAGIGGAAFHPQAVAQAARASKDRRGWGVSIFFTGGAAGSALMTAIIGPLAVVFGTGATVIALLPALAVSALFLRAKRSWLMAVAQTRTSMGLQLRPVALPLGLLLMVSILRSGVMTGFITFIPSLVVARGGSLPFATLVLASFLLAGASGALLGGLLANRFGGAAVVAVSLLIGLVTLLPVPYLPSALLVPWLFLAGTMIFASEAQVTVLAQRLLPGMTGIASSLMMGVGLGIGNLGAFLTGALADTTGITRALTLLPLLMLVALGAAVIFWVLMRHGDADSTV